MTIPNGDKIEEGSWTEYDNPLDLLPKKDEPDAGEAKPDGNAGADSANGNGDDSSKPSWKDEIYSDAEDAHGWYRGKTKGEVDAGIRRLEGATSEAQHRANLAEAKAAAAEVANKMLQDRLRQALEMPKPAEPAQQPEPEEDIYKANGVDLQSDWVMAPEKVEKLLESKLLSKAERRNIELLNKKFDELKAELTQKEREKFQAEERDTLISQIEKAAVDASTEALTKLNVPKEHWHSVLDLVVPQLTNLKGKYAEKGGITATENYIDIIENNPIVRAGVKSIVGVPAQADEPAPPGAKAPVVQQRADKPALTGLSQEVISLARQQAILAGVAPDSPEMDEFMTQTATKIAENRRKRARNRN
jgi:hypothetical protein